jgi:hypothetical protein
VAPAPTPAPGTTAPTPPTPGTAPTPSTTPSPSPEAAAQPQTDLALNQRFGAGGGETVSAPNVIGDLLYTSRSVAFGFVRINGVTNFQGLASTSIVNSAVDENNSPLPEDRVYFRYNYFNRSQFVTGLSPFTIVQQNIIPPPGFIVTTPPVLLQLPTTKAYDTNLYTFGVEQTFLDRRLSVELRVPVFTGLASDLTFSVASVASGPLGATGGVPFQNFALQSTPQNTLGHEDTEFGNLTVILKGLAYQDRASGLAFSGGLGVTAPTGEDAKVRVIDFGSPEFNPFASLQRRQDIVVANDIVSLSPFLAALWTPSRNFFTQGFAAVEVPVGRSRVTYTDQHFGIPVGATTFAPIGPPFVNNVRAVDAIAEQTLLHIDLNAGYWVYRAPTTSWLSGIAPCLEVHYTGTLDNADRVQLPSDGATVLPAVPLSLLPFRTVVPEVVAPGPVVGGQRNHVNIVDLTVGTTFVFGDRVTLASAFSFPVTNQANRTFDWEYQLQLNYYWGRSR